MIGRLLCAIGVHRWCPWFADSWDHAMRRSSCDRCGRVRVEKLY